MLFFFIALQIATFFFFKTYINVTKTPIEKKVPIIYGGNYMDVCAAILAYVYRLLRISSHKTQQIIQIPRKVKHFFFRIFKSKTEIVFFKGKKYRNSHEILMLMQLFTLLSKHKQLRISLKAHLCWSIKSQFS